MKLRLHFSQTMLDNSSSCRASLVLVLWGSEGFALLPAVGYTHTCMQICHESGCKVLHLLFGLWASFATEGEELTLGAELGPNGTGQIPFVPHD